LNKLTSIKKKQMNKLNNKSNYVWCTKINIVAELYSLKER
jgi:hypothetical protein